MIFEKVFKHCFITINEFLVNSNMEVYLVIFQ